jgi:hypothetical protein
VVVANTREAVGRLSRLRPVHRWLHCWICVDHSLVGRSFSVAGGAGIPEALFGKTAGRSQMEDRQRGLPRGTGLDLIPLTIMVEEVALVDSMPAAVACPSPGWALG